LSQGKGAAAGDKAARSEKLEATPQTRGAGAAAKQAPVDKPPGKAAVPPPAKASPQVQAGESGKRRGGGAAAKKPGKSRRALKAQPAVRRRA
jgi:hypothetical protein